MWSPVAGTISFLPHVAGASGGGAPIRGSQPLPGRHRGPAWHYRWSSAATHLTGGKDRSGVLDQEFWRRAGGAAAWAELHGREENAAQLLALRKCTYAGRPFGSEAFVCEMEERFQRKWLRVAKSKPEPDKNAIK